MTDWLTIDKWTDQTTGHFLSWFACRISNVEIMVRLPAIIPLPGNNPGQVVDTKQYNWVLV